MSANINSFISKAIESSKVVIFSKTYCPYCVNAKKLFDGIGQKYSVYELDQMEDGSDIQSTLKTMTGQSTVPNIFINGKHVGGFDKTSELHNSGKLKAMLN